MVYKPDRTDRALTAFTVAAAIFILAIILGGIVTVAIV